MKNQNKLERFFRKHAIRNLSLIIIMCYGFGYVLQLVNADFLNYLTLNPYAICHGQVWRLITWVLVPPDTSNIFFVIIAMLFYYSIGTALERTWGTYQYNLYIFGGVLMTIIGAFVMMIISMLLYGGSYYPYGITAENYFATVAQTFSTYYVNMSIFLAYAATFPNATVLFMFIIPVKVKWLGIIYGILLAYDFISRAVAGYWFMCIAMAASLANFLIYWLRTRQIRRLSPSEIKRRREFKKKVSQGEQEWKNGTAGNASRRGRFSGGKGSSDGKTSSGSRRTKSGPDGVDIGDGWKHTTHPGSDNSNDDGGADSPFMNHEAGKGYGSNSDSDMPGCYSSSQQEKTGWNDQKENAGWNDRNRLAGEREGGGRVHMRGSASRARHRCAICGRTELDDPNLEFRYCSKCQGNYEFCQDHLFTHIHAANGQPPRLMENSENPGN